MTWDHENNPSDRTKHLVNLDKNALIERVLDLEEQLAVTQRVLPADATFLGQRVVEDDLHTINPRVAYQNRMGVRASHICTIIRPENTSWIMERLIERFSYDTLKEMTVIEIGAGMGFLAVDLASVCKHVFAVESDPLFSRAFAQKLYDEKPENLTWIFDVVRTEMSSLNGGWLPAADLTIVVTGSDEVELRKLAVAITKPEGSVMMPWQDYKGGRAIVDYRGWRS